MVGQASGNGLDRAVGFFINRCSHMMAEVGARLFEEAGYRVTAQDFAILFRLWKQDGLTQVQLSHLMLRDKTTITRRIDGLVKKGLVERRCDPKGRRLFRIHLTDVGEGAVCSMVAQIDAFYGEVLSGVPDADREATIRTLKTIIDHIARKGM